MPPDVETRQEQSTLVGRDYEVSQLRAALDGAMQRRTQLVEIVGPAGIGKTRLAAELPQLAPQCFFHAVTCERYRAGEAYAAVRSLLRTVAGIRPDAGPDEAGVRLRTSLTAIAPELLPVLALLAAPCGAQVDERDAAPADPARRRALMNNAVDALLSRTLTAPTVLLFEDAHWMDDASRALITHVVERGVPKPWLVCVTRRLEGAPIAPQAGRVVIALQPLGRESASALGRELAGAPLLPSELARIVERAGGNPFFLRELVAALGDASLPESVEHVLRAQLAALSADDSLLLSRAAAIGRVFDLGLLRSLLDDGSDASELGARLGALDAFVVEQAPDRFMFRHDLLQETAYLLIGEEERPQIHARLATELAHSGQEDASTLALHFRYACLWEESWRYSLEAARAAQGRYANEVAVELYELAIEAAPRSSATDDDVSDIRESLADALVLSGRFEQAEAGFRALLPRHAASPGRHARLLRKCAECLVLRGEFDDASVVLDEALTVLPSEAWSAERAEILVVAAGVALRRGRYADTVELAEEVVAQVGETTRDELRLRARAYMLRETSLDVLGGPRTVRERLEALAIYEELGDVDGRIRVLNSLGVHAYFDGAWSDALRAYRQATKLSREIGDINQAAITLNNEGEILSDQGRLGEAQSRFREAVELFGAAGSRDGVAVATRNLGRLAARDGRFDEAEALLAEAVEEFASMGAAAYGAVARAYLAESYVLAGRHRVAWESAGDALPRHTKGHPGRSRSSTGCSGTRRSRTSSPTSRPSSSGGASTPRSATVPRTSMRRACLQKPRSRSARASRTPSRYARRRRPSSSASASSSCR